MEIKIIAQMDNTIDNTFESANRIYDVEGLAPTLPTGCGGGHTPKILEARRIGIIACFAINGSQNFGMKPNGGV